MRLLSISLLLAAVPVSASTVVNGGSLFTQTRADQFATWLGEGDLTLTNVYASGSGFSPSAWHSQVDNVGRTVTLILTDLGLIGGYNPVSWTSSLGPVYTNNPTDAGRTAFIFNLSTGVLQRQRLGLTEGQYQTFNYSPYGPTFGGGHDIYTGASSGYALSYSYGPGAFAPGTLNLFGGGYNLRTNFQVLGVETFTIGPGPAVPEPATSALIGLGLVALGRRARAAASKRP